MNYGFVKTACATPEIKVADCMFNSEQIVSQLSFAAQKGASLVVFPELCVTGSTCGDLFKHRFLIQQAEIAVAHILQKTRAYNCVFVIGTPVAVDDALYNCACVIYNGEILGIVPKINLSVVGSKDELRYFKLGKDVDREIVYANRKTRISSKLTFSCKALREFKFAVEIGEDFLSPQPVSQGHTISGKAMIIANPSATPFNVDESDKLRNTILSTGSRLSCAYLRACAGVGESTTDAVYTGSNIITEIDEVLNQSEGFFENITYADVDVYKIAHERRNNPYYNCFDSTDSYTDIEFNMVLRQTRLKRRYSKYPFIPETKSKLDDKCKDILKMQALGLATRMKNAGIEDLVLGVSGGLDSTLALIACVRALDIMGLDRKKLHAVSMPCFGTTMRTKSNAQRLCEIYSVDFKEINISNAVRQHFSDIGHDENNHNATYENSQARMRTTVLMDLANKHNGLVVGTGDMSELALGWATYNGDHMSMYGVNASIPKTMVRCLVKYEADCVGGMASSVLCDILDTPVSPELLPPDKNGDISQITEDVVGPYELHDFFLYCFVRYNFSPEKIFYIALKTFEGDYDRYTIKRFLHKFFLRFFTQQFKRSCMPDGVSVGNISLSPRGGLSMPSDAQVNMWLDRINEL